MDFLINKLATGSKPYLVALLVVFVIDIPVLWTLHQARLQLDNDKETFQKEREQWTDSKNEDERMAESLRSDFLVSERESREKIASLEKQLREKTNDAETLKQENKILDSLNQKYSAESRLVTLMSEFSRLGVNLSQPPDCTKPQEVRRYNSAKSKYDEIMMVVKTNGMISEYKDFLLINQSVLVDICAQ